jgi:rubrerythrin
MDTTVEAVAAAKQLEVEGRSFYLEAANRSSNKAVGTMFTSLAADEENHLRWLDALASGTDSPAEANRALLAALKDVFGSFSADEVPAHTATDTAAIDFAIGIEDRSARVYGEWAQNEDQSLRDLGRVLVGQERFHRQLLENAREYLERPGDWFMQEERWNFEGG